VSRDSSPALIIRFPSPTTASTRDQLVSLLSDHDLLAIQEDDVAAPRKWIAHFGSSASRDTAAAALAAVSDDTPLQMEAVDVEDEDWARRTQADLPAVRIGRVVVAPPWDLPALTDSRPPSGAVLDVVVEIEPSRGFGTGHHQSTRLCLALLQSRDLKDRTVIDVGTGSGVLAIVAARLGAASVWAIDVDPEAVENARENIHRNQVDHVVEAHTRDVTEASLIPADFVTANLTGTLLARHAGALAALVRPSGSLIAAGFTADEKVLVTDVFKRLLDVSEAAEEDDWCAFVLTRRQGAC
jgi:ribosomal protein L11 methyltransferase